MRALLVEAFAYLFGHLVVLVFELLFQVLLDFAISGYQESFDKHNRHPAEATLGYAILGALGGFVWLLFWPQRLLPPLLPSGASLVIAPLVAGTAMHFWGRRRRTRGLRTSSLATFYGGAGFAFGVALVRLLFLV